MRLLRFHQLHRGVPATLIGTLVSILIVNVLAACSTSAPPPQTPSEDLPMRAALPAAYYRQAQARGETVFRVDPKRSLIRIEARRGGTLARLGHDHLIASRDINGYVAPDAGRTDIAIPLATLTVDEPALRADAGFTTQPSQEAIEGTRRNMLVKVLESERFPFILIHATRAAPSASSLNVTMTLHGVTRTFVVPARIDTAPDQIRVSGEMHIKQSDFGIVPFSVLGGAMQVQDQLVLRFLIVAE